MSVAVKSGKVAVYRMRESENERKDDLLLAPNQKAVFSSDRNLISRKLVEAPVVLEGQEETLSFDYVETPVSKIFESLEKAYGIKIVYDAGTFSGCSMTIQAKYTVSGNDVVISGAGCN